MTPFSRALSLPFHATVALVLIVFMTVTARAVEIQRVVSPQGIEAWLVEDNTVPLVAMNFSFDNGAALDPESKSGLTRLLSATLDEGAADLDSEAYQARLEQLAISIGFSTSRDAFFGSLRTLAPTVDEAFDMLSIAVNEPRFDEDAVERIKAQLIAGVRRQQKEPNAIAGKAFMASVFGEHPYAIPTSGTESTLESLTPGDLDQQHRALFSRSGLRIGVVGAIDAGTLGLLLDKVFADLPENTELGSVADAEAAFGERVSETLPVPQTSIMIGLPGLKRDDPDFQAAFVMNHILGGGTFTSWLFEEVREKRGLSYGANSSIIPYEHAGMIIATAATRADRANETLDVMLDQIDRMATEGPTSAELEAAKRFLTGSYALRFDTSGKIASQLVALQNADLPIDYFEKRNAEIEAVSLEDVQRVAQRLLATQDPTVVTVGPAVN
ncbi:zinc protease [Roseibium hamelinense]|uniref:Zinc protease n=1 Tax=Roseibium hamelinense TaxID=150831 RepID=A0A562T2P9_9HYPH|nr:pitrilysin family protein [Roseibium hamelinense]MTI43378.1 insulinase family protein [Roseibium hamelinense]TWI87578.1 zinc protease [Roseibium hamelinense]